MPRLRFLRQSSREEQGLTPLVGLLVVGLSLCQSPSAGCQLEQLMGREAVRLAGDPDETGLFQRRQVARREEVRTPVPECRTHTRKPRDAPDEVHKPRTLPVVEKERTMGDTTDQNIGKDTVLILLLTFTMTACPHNTYLCIPRGHTQMPNPNRRFSFTYHPTTEL